MSPLAAAEPLSGHALAEELNCAACHATDRLPHSRRGPDLSAIGERTNAAWIFKWLENPRHFRATAAMPRVLAAPQDRADVAAYLVTLGGDPPAPLPAHDTAAERGRELFDEIGCLACHGPQPQAHSLAGLGSKMTSAALARYLADPLAVDPSGRMPGFDLSASEAASLARHLASSRNPEFEQPAPAGDAARGRELVQAHGCINCHTVKEPEGHTLETRLTAPPFAALQPGRGCLAEKPAGRAPDYALTTAERTALTNFVMDTVAAATGGASTQPASSEAAESEAFHRLTEKFNCRACHELDGPATLTFPAHRAPPSLRNAGDKLRASWIDAVLREKKRSRPWLAARMPHYGDAVKPLAAALAHRGASSSSAAPAAGSAASEAQDAAAWPKATAAEVAAGVKILGRAEGGLACINCHYFGAEKPGGEVLAPDLAGISARLKPDWVRRFLWDPQAVAPGTVMPAFFSALPGNEGREKIEQVLRAFSAGKRMPQPAGLIADAAEYHVVVKDKPVVMRTFMPQSSTRSIAVGLPGGQNYVFDAEQGRLRYAWRGEFLDARPVWADRGGAPAKIRGEKWFTAPEGFPLRFGAPDRVPKEIEFLGYTLRDSVPEFELRVDGHVVKQRIVAASEASAGLVIEFQIPENVSAWWIDPPPGAAPRKLSAQTTIPVRPTLP